uniref:Putative transport and golgi organization n=1 Tax=Corethrella appendiculata TaxID=1370023 RepID=U5EUX5_9DIPT
MHDQTNQQQQDSVVEMNNSTSVLHKIANLYAEQLMSDICLVVGNNRYPAHRVILCASSEVFQVMLMNPEWNECREKVIELKEDPLCSLVFPQFLKYLYVGQIRISLQTVMPMLALADKYNIGDLVQLCVDYMLKHIAKAATQGFLVSWLQYTISFSPNHKEVTEALQKFLKWNLDIVAETNDFCDLDVNYLIVLLQQNDLVLQSEFSLFEYVEKWLMNKKEQIEREPDLNDDEKQHYVITTLHSVIVHIRFAMMTPTELSKLLVRPIMNWHKEFFVERIAIGMSYHSGQIERVQEIRSQETGALQFTPRLYTTDVWGFTMTIKEFEKIENYQNIAACFFSQSNLSEDQEDQQVSWDIDFFPRGIRYDRGILIRVFPGCLEIPEAIIKTVRLRVICRENLEQEQKFMIGVLITGVQNKIPHIRTCHVRTSYFSQTNCVVNIDNLLPFEELLLSSLKLSAHLIGDQRDTINIQVIIAPMGPFVCLETPTLEF